MQKKQRKDQKRGDENTTNGLDPFDDDDDEDKLRDMARRFEAKYVSETRTLTLMSVLMKFRNNSIPCRAFQGTSTMGKKRHKYDDYVDLGAGYDENDSFIDNTDAVSVARIFRVGKKISRRRPLSLTKFFSSSGSMTKLYPKR